jgi:dihydroorotase
MPTEKLLIKSAFIIGNGFDFVGDILVEDGAIKAIDKNIEVQYTDVIDAQRLCVAPGLVDMHVHLRDPGQTNKEDIVSGCMAAAAGGVTSLAAMPNTRPVADNANVLNYITQKAKLCGVHVYPIAAVTKGQQGNTLCDFEALCAAGAVAFSDDGRPVIQASTMLAAMRLAAANNVPIISHCEDLSLADGIINEGEISRKLGVKGVPGAAESVQAAREATLAASYGLPVHIAHVSSAVTVDIIRDAKRRGVKITAETCPHYFSLDESLVLSRDADYRMNPPLRTRHDVEAIIEGLRDGTIDAIVTDHAPHTSEEKSDFESAPNGVVGLETSLAVGITYLVRPGFLTLGELIEKMTVNPARILNIKAGTLEVGSPADLVLFDQNESFTVDPSKLHSKSHNTPFKGMTLYGRVKYTISSGKIIYRF